AVDEATEAERGELKKLVEDKADPLDLVGVWGDLSGGELARLRAKLHIEEKAGDAAGIVNDSQLADPTVQVLRALGGVDVDTVYDAIKLSAGATWARFKAEWDKAGVFHDYVYNNTTMPDTAYVGTTILSDNLDLRLNFCFGAFSDDEDYLFHLLGNFASNVD